MNNIYTKNVNYYKYDFFHKIKFVMEIMMYFGFKAINIYL